MNKPKYNFGDIVFFAHISGIYPLKIGMIALQDNLEGFRYGEYDWYKDKLINEQDLLTEKHLKQIGYKIGEQDE